jgi:hypothetical protein
MEHQTHLVRRLVFVRVDFCGTPIIAGLYFGFPQSKIFDVLTSLQTSKLTNQARHGYARDQRVKSPD